MQQTLKPHIRTTYLTFVTLGSVFLLFIGLTLVGLNVSIYELDRSPAEVGLTQDIDYSAFPIRFAIMFTLVLSPSLLIALTLDLLVVAYVPDRFTFVKYILRRNVHLMQHVGLMFTALWTYIVLFQDNTTAIEIMRRLSLILYCLFHAMGAAAVLGIGISLLSARQLLPIWLCWVLTIGGGLSLVFCVLAMNPDLPILQVGLPYLPYFFGLVLMSIYVLVVTRGTSDHQTPSTTTF